MVKKKKHGNLENVANFVAVAIAFAIVLAIYSIKDLNDDWFKLQVFCFDSNSIARSPIGFESQNYLRIRCELEAIPDKNVRKVFRVESG